MKLPATDPELGIPNMMPLIDLIFLLLIFFLMASSFKKQAREERELKVMLPEVAEAQPLASTEDLVINISPEGKYVVSQKELNEEKLAALLSLTHRTNPQKPVMIRADGRAQWKHGVRVMGLCNKAQISNYRVAALQEQ
jgi:biopolymer transport protein ExbD